MTRGREGALAPAQASLGDAEAMHRMALGEIGALGVLYDRYHHNVRQFLRFASGRPEEVDDLTQEVFLTVARVAGTYDGRPCARPFIIGVAAQLSRNRRHTLARWARALALFGASTRGALHRTPEDEAASTEAFAALDGALARLTDEKRLVFLMFVREGISGEDVASALGIPVATVWTRLHSARAELRRAIETGGKP